MTLRLGSYYYALQLLSSLSHPYHGAVTEVIDRAQGLKKSDLKEPLHKVCLEIIWDASFLSKERFSANKFEDLGLCRHKREQANPKIFVLSKWIIIVIGIFNHKLTVKKQYENMSFVYTDTSNTIIIVHCKIHQLMSNTLLITNLIFVLTFCAFSVSNEYCCITRCCRIFMRN